MDSPMVQQIFSSRLVSSTMLGATSFNSDGIRARGNYVVLAVTVISFLAGGSLAVKIQGSLDGVSWSDATTTPVGGITITSGPGYQTEIVLSGITYPWLRMTGTLAASTTVVFDATFAFAET